MTIHDENAGFPQPTAAESAVSALVANKDRLGLTWDLKPATALSTDPTTKKVVVMVDGDSVPVTAESMVGTIDSNTRVFVIIVPPGGIFVVGFVNKAPDRPTPMAIAGASGVTSTSGSGAPGPVSSTAFNWSSGTPNDMVWKNGRVYRVDWISNVSNNGGWTNFNTFIKSTVSGTIIQGFSSVIPDNGHITISVCAWGLVYNNSGTDFETGVGIAIQRTASQLAGTVSLDGSFLTVTDIAAVDTFTTLFGVQVA